MLFTTIYHRLEEEKKEFLEKEIPFEPIMTEEEFLRRAPLFAAGVDDITRGVRELHKNIKIVQDRQAQEKQDNKRQETIFRPATGEEKTTSLPDDTIHLLEEALSSGDDRQSSATSQPIAEETIVSPSDNRYRFYKQEDTLSVDTEGLHGSSITPRLVPMDADDA